MASVSGENAVNHDAVRLDTMLPVNFGPLVSADEVTGEVAWKDKITNEDKKLTLGPHAIRILPKSAYGR